jgi:hypothetical protein
MCKNSAKMGNCEFVEQKSELVDPTSFCPKKLSQVTGLKRGQVSRKIIHRQRFRRHLRFIENHMGKAGFDICVVKPERVATAPLGFREPRNDPNHDGPLQGR